MITSVKLPSDSPHSSYIYVCMYVCIYVYIHTHTHIYIHIQHTQIAMLGWSAAVFRWNDPKLLKVIVSGMDLHMASMDRRYVYVHICMHVFQEWICTWLVWKKCMRSYICMCVCMCICIYVCMCFRNVFTPG